MVKIEYIDGTEETVETVDNELYKNKPFLYVKDVGIFIVLGKKRFGDCMMIPREFVKSIRHIEV